MPQGDFSRFIQPDLVAGMFEERQTKFLFQLFDRGAQRRLGDMEFCGCR